MVLLLKVTAVVVVEGVVVEIVVDLVVDEMGEGDRWDAVGLKENGSGVERETIAGTDEYLPLLCGDD